MNMNLECLNFWKTSLVLQGSSNSVENLWGVGLHHEFRRYKEPTEQLSQLVEALNTQRTEKLNRVKLVEKEKDELEAPKNEAMAYVKLENELSQYKYTLQQVCTQSAII